MLGMKLSSSSRQSGFGCINRLQRATGGESFNNLLRHTRHEMLPEIDFAQHAASLGAKTMKVSGIAALEKALRSARRATITTLNRDRYRSASLDDAGGHWWDVAVPRFRRAARWNRMPAISKRKKPSVSETET